MSVKIDQALILHFVGGDFGIDAAYENQPYTPRQGVPYAEVSVLQNDITPVDLHYNNETDGTFRVVLRYPINTGAVAAKEMADQIFAHFAIGEQLSFDGQDLLITSHHRMSGASEQGLYKIVLTIGYQAYILR
jgi:hypothetical protein